MVKPENKGNFNFDSKGNVHQYQASSLAQWIVWVAQLDRAPARKAGDPGLIPGPSENSLLNKQHRTRQKIVLKN